MNNLVSVVKNNVFLIQIFNFIHSSLGFYIIGFPLDFAVGFFR